MAYSDNTMWKRKKLPAGFWAWFFSLFLISVPISFYKAYVITVLWAWFIIPFGVMGITFWHACGLMGVISMLTMKFDVSKDENSIDIKKSISDSIAYALIYTIALGSGWIYHTFMIMK